MRYLLAIFVLGLMVAVHELGHLVAARLFRIPVERFAFGFGPPLLSFRRRGVELSLRAIPFGGYARIPGLSAPDEDSGGEEGFARRPPWQRALVVLAGPVANGLVALAILFALYLGGTRVPVPRTIGTVTPGSGAAQAQLRPGDEVLEVNGEAVETWSDLVEAVEASPDQPLFVRLRRGGAPLEVEVTPRPDEYGQARIGVEQQYAYRDLSAGQAAAHAARHALALIADGARAGWRILRGRPAGPIVLAQRAASSSGAGANALAAAAAAISIGLALFSLLPFPALDGGRLLLMAVARLRGKPLDPRWEALGHAGGFVVLLALAVWLAVRDLSPTSGATGDSGTPGPAADAGVDGGVSSDR